MDWSFLSINFNFLKPNCLDLFFFKKKEGNILDILNSQLELHKSIIQKNNIIIDNINGNLRTNVSLSTESTKITCDKLTDRLNNFNISSKHYLSSNEDVRKLVIRELSSCVKNNKIIK